MNYTVPQLEQAQDMIKPLKLKHLNLPSNLVQGPLAGYSTAPFRALTHRYGKPGYAVTEMISAKDLVCRNPNPKRYLYKHPEEGFLGYQLACDDPEYMKRAIDIIRPYNPEMLDLNCGCPVKKIRHKGLGSKLLVTPEKIHALVLAMKEASDAVVSVKIRVDAGRGEQDNLAIVDAAESAGVDFLIVHGRHWQERYDIPCRLEEIKAVKDYASVPVLANGDAEDYISAKQLFDETGCDGIMVARASVGQPWLFQEIEAGFRGETFVPPSLPERGEIFIEHIELLAALENEKTAVLQSRKFAKYYARGIEDRIEFTQKCHQVSQLSELKELVSTYLK